MADARKTDGEANALNRDSWQTVLLDRVSDMITVSDRDGWITYANAATERIIGYSPEVFTQRHPFESIHPDDLPRCEEATARLISTPGLTLKLEHRILHRDGSWRWVEVTLESLFGDPAVGGLLATVRDVTGRMRSEDELRESQEELQRTLSRLTMAMKATRAGWGNWNLLTDKIEWSAEGREIMGFESEDEASSSEGWLERIHPEDRPKVKAHTACAFANNGDFNIEYRVVRSDGEIRWLLGTGKAHHDEDGTATHSTGLVIDITERKLAAESVQISGEQLRTVVEQSLLAITIFAPDGTSLRSNEAWRRLWNLDPDGGGDPTGYNVFDDERLATAGFIPCLRDGAVGRESVTDPLLYDPASIGLGEDEKWLRAFVYPVRDVSDGEVSQVVLMLQETTDSKLRRKSHALVRDAAMRAEKLERERISRELHDRVAHSMGVAHQSLELYKALVGRDSERAEERLELASRTVRDVLNQTRNLAIKLRRSVAEEVEGGLKSALEDMLQTLVPDNVRSQLHFSGDDPDIPSESLTQVYLLLREAVNNACRHSMCSDIEVRVSIDEEYIRGSVTDDGEGFDYDALLANGDTGIGLRAMRERAELLGGELTVGSHPGDGATLAVEIPLIVR